MKRKMLYVFLALVLISFNTFTVFAQDQVPPDRGTGRELPARIEALKLESPIRMDGTEISGLHTSLVGVQGPQRVIFTLSAESGAGAYARGADTASAKSAAQAQQKAFLVDVKKLDPGARVVAVVQLVLNAVILDVDAAALPGLARDPRVLRIAPVGNYQVDLSETVPYIGATAVQAAGYDGSGIKVAVLDTGIDYLHAAIGGSGDPAEFAANDPTIIEPGTFPTAKVVGGYDFVGGAWPNEDLAPDPDPLDAGSDAGHGTHVAHIIGGVGGVAPGVDLYGVKVCSSISTACSGVALIQAMEFAADPNGDGKIKDRVDIINMSLGSDYGQPFDDDLSLAVNNATKLGILTVAAAGNGGNRPYVAGTPAAAETAISVAQTSVPSDFLPLMEVVSPPAIAGLYPAVYQSWSAPLAAVIEGPLQYGDGAGGNLNGCAPFAAGSLAGKIVLVDRGACNFTLKISNISVAGGLAGIIGLVAPGDPFVGGDGGDRPIDIPGFMISQAISNLLKGQIAVGVTVRFDPATGIPLVGSMVGSSARGPQHEYTQLIKPEIGAPGGSLSAETGTGTGETVFSGTSGATPMVAGSAALLMDKFRGSDRFVQVSHGLTPLEVKALLMNNAETAIIENALTGELAPISRIGGGEVRVDRALNAPVVAWNDPTASAALSFGFVDVTDTVRLTREIRVRNLDNQKHTYTATPTFRFANDEASGAVTVKAPATVNVMPGYGNDTFFTVEITIDGSLLPDNAMSSGGGGADAAALTLNEYDGYLVLQEGGYQLSIPWHVLPRKAAQVLPDTQTIVPGSFPQVIGLNNEGVGTAQNDAYNLIAVSPDLPEGGPGELAPTPDIRAVGVNTFIVPAGFCSDTTSFLWAFAINTWERQEHLVPVNHNVYLDTNQDGTYDYAVFNFDLSLSSSISDGRQLTWTQDLATGAADAWFFAEHSTNTGNTVLYFCAEQVGLTIDDLLTTNVNIAVEAFDWFNGGPGDFIEGLTVTPLGERFLGIPTDVPGKTDEPEGLSVYDFDMWPGNTPDLGLLLVTNGDRGAGRRGGATQDTEALLFLTQ
jgi:minor extracellular serine protease Vpr